MLTREERESLQRRYYPSLDQVVFGPLHAALSRPEFRGATVLDAGCGKGTWILEQHRSHLGLLVGVDVGAAESTSADAYSVCSLEGLPFGDASFDLVLCYVVLEHLEQPMAALQEFWRVLRPGGALILKTPAAYAPTSLLTRLLPFAAHGRLKGLIGIAQDDVFPTYFRCNSVRSLRRSLADAGFTSSAFHQIDQTYAYASLSRLTYVLGLLYSRALQHPWLRWLRNGIVVVSEKGAR